MEHFSYLRKGLSFATLPFFIAISLIPNNTNAADIQSAKPAHISVNPVYIGEISWPEHENVSWHIGPECREQGSQRVHTSSLPDPLIRTPLSFQASAISKAAKEIAYDVYEKKPSYSSAYVLDQLGGAILNIEVLSFSLKACRRGENRTSSGFSEVLESQNELTGNISIKFSLFSDDPAKPSLEHTSSSLLHEFNWNKSIGLFRQEMLSKEAIEFISSPEVVAHLQSATSTGDAMPEKWIQPDTPPQTVPITNWLKFSVVNPFLHSPANGKSFGEIMYGPGCDEINKITADVLWEKRRALMMEDWPAGIAMERWASRHGYQVANNGYEVQQAISIEGRVSNMLFSACKPGISEIARFGEGSSSTGHGYALSRAQITIDWTINDPATPGQVLTRTTTGTSVVSSPAENSIEAYRMALDHAIHLLMADKLIWGAESEVRQPSDARHSDFLEKQNHADIRKDPAITQWPWNMSNFNLQSLADRRKGETGFLYKGITCHKYSRYSPYSVLLPKIASFELKERFATTLASR
ncbi:MAG: hypothetical protein V2I38_01550, partial [Alcanivoracaceae bacterium]|nr:hypothetical protein [Alcanivoracaceae bacterium]